MMLSPDPAEVLYHSVAETEHTSQSPIASGSGRKRASSGVPEEAVVRTKRAQVAVACQACRLRKSKCDAGRPCTSCARRRLECRYDTQKASSNTQLLKQRCEEATRSLETHLELYQMLGTRNERDIAQILRWIRDGHGAEMVVKLIKTDAATAVPVDLSRLAIQAFLVSLAHSTGSLGEIVELATSRLDPLVRAQLQDPDAFLIFRNRIVHLPCLEALLQRSERLINGSPTSLSNHGIATTIENGVSPDWQTRNASLFSDEDRAADGDPPLQVPATPWTTIIKSDGAISHLVSLFFAWINPTWRFVEQDLFLSGMRSKWLHSDFCSPLLVNSICAIASLQSEHDAAFTGDDRDRITRGQHFHQEALRLWALEENRPKLTSVQALCILSLESNYRAKDRLGLSLIATAVQLGNDLSPLQGDEVHNAVQGVTAQDYTRARLATYWTARCAHVIMRIAFMSGTTGQSHALELPKINDVFADSVDSWVGYPLSKTVVTYRPTLYLRERCRLAELFGEIDELIIPDDKTRHLEIREFATKVDELSVKMQNWYGHLPFELHYAWPMSVAVWELHASYLAFLMIFWLAARTRFLLSQDSSDDHPSSAEPCAEHDRETEDCKFGSRAAQEKLSDSIVLAHKAAQFLRDLRKRFGLKISPAWSLQLQAVAVGVLLLDPELTDPASVVSPDAKDSNDPIQDSHTAFDEIFRCLLGSGVEVMIARGIARMTYHTALDRKIALSSSTRSMLQILSSTAWRPSDLSLVNSVYPNFATVKGHDDRQRMSELLSKWETLEL